ncbi:MAG: hypothetical protein Q9192_005837 [Flavoplaca navasiana]
MHSLYRVFPFASFLFVLLLSQVLPSTGLPATKPEAYVTQLDDGQVQVRYSAPSTSDSTTTTPFMFFNQAGSGGSLSASSTASTLTSQTDTLPSTASEERPMIKSGAVDPGSSSTDSTSATDSATAGAIRTGSGDSGALSSSSNHQSPAQPRTTFSSSTIGATGTSSQLQSNPSPETDAQTPLPVGTGSVTAGIHNSGIGVQSNQPAPEGQETSSMSNPLPPNRFTEAGTQTNPTKRPGVDTSSGTPASVISMQFSSSKVSSPTAAQPLTPMITTTEAASTKSPPTGAEPSLSDRPADPTATPETGDLSTSISINSELPFPSLKVPASQGPQTTTEGIPTLRGDIIGIPTATWTTAPPDVKLEVMTKPAWSSDTLVTTTLPGSNEPIVAPVFANCDGCGPGGSLVVFGSFNPGISYNLPKIPGFPSVPRFHLPCIAFCPSPGGSSPGGTPPKPGPPKREDENGKTIEDNGGKQKDDKGNDKNDDNGGKQNDDKGNDKNDDNGDDNGDDKSDDKTDDKNDEENTNQDDQQNDEQEDEQNDEEEEDEDEQQSTSSQTAEPTSSTGPTSSTPSSTRSSTSSSTSSSSSSSTEMSVVTDTAYINVRPTDIFARDPEMEQYLLAAYSSLGIADDQVDTEPVPTATGLGITFFPESSMIPKSSSSSSSTSSSIHNSTSLPSTSSSSSSSPTPSPSEYKPDYNVEEINHGEMPDPLVCHGVGGDTWMIHRDQAVSAAEQFCEQEDEEKE